MIEYHNFLEVQRIYVGSQIFIGELGIRAMYERQKESAQECKMRLR